MVDLKKERMDKGLTQQELADRCGVLRQTISSIECGFNLPSVKTAIAIGDTLGFGWEKFFENISHLE